MRQQPASSGPIYNIREYPVVAPEVHDGAREGVFTGVYKMSNGRVTALDGRYFGYELGITDERMKGGRLAERLSVASLEALSRADGRSIQVLLSDNNIKG